MAADRDAPGTAQCLTLLLKWCMMHLLLSSVSRGSSVKERYQGIYIFYYYFSNGVFNF